MQGALPGPGGMASRLIAPRAITAIIARRWEKAKRFQLFAMSRYLIDDNFWTAAGFTANLCPQSLQKYP
jgi:hypothetical protein